MSPAGRGTIAWATSWRTPSGSGASRPWRRMELNKTWVFTFILWSNDVKLNIYPWKITIIFFSGKSSKNSRAIYFQQRSVFNYRRVLEGDQLSKMAVLVFLGTVSPCVILMMFPANKAPWFREFSRPAMFDLLEGKSNIC